MKKITVSFAGQEISTTAAADGRWKVSLKPLEASAESRTLTVKGHNTLTFKNVLVGEVWICSGQSQHGLGRRPPDSWTRIGKSPRPASRNFV